MAINQELRYIAVPSGAPVPGEHLKRVEEELDVDSVELHGGVLVKNLALSLDPYMRGRMRDPKIQSYAPAYDLGKVIQGYGVGEVVRSDIDSIKKGQAFYGFTDFSSYVVIPASRLDQYRVLENKEKLPWTQLVGSAGMPGQTAWWGLHNIGKPKKGETLFVSAAAGAVGQVVGQLAKKEGLKVVGSAGSDEKVAFLKSLGFDVAFNYKKENTLEKLQENPPDIYFDNVGGQTLDDVIATIKPYGRIIACGSVSQYNLPRDQQYRLQNWAQVTAKQLTYQGFIISIGKNLDEFYRTIPSLIASGDLKTREHVTKGIDNGEAFVDMLSGKAEGKAVISLE